MVVLDEKCVIPPPPYAAEGLVAPPPFPGNRSHQSLATLPPHLLLKIVYMVFPRAPGRDESQSERQRKTLYWLSRQLRLVNRSFYIGNPTTYQRDNQNLTYRQLACMYCGLFICPPMGPLSVLRTRPTRFLSPLHPRPLLAL